MADCIRSASVPLRSGVFGNGRLGRGQVDIACTDLQEETSDGGEWLRNATAPPGTAGDRSRAREAAASGGGPLPTVPVGLSRVALCFVQFSRRRSHAPRTRIKLSHLKQVLQTAIRDLDGSGKSITAWKSCCEARFDVNQPVPERPKREARAACGAEAARNRVNQLPVASRSSSTPLTWEPTTSFPEWLRNRSQEAPAAESLCLPSPAPPRRDCFFDHLRADWLASPPTPSTTC